MEGRTGIDAHVDWACSIEPRLPTPAAADAQLAALALGMLADAGEVADLVKKHLAGAPLDRAHLAHELGDVLFWWSRLCAATGIPASELLARNRRHREAR
jgi:NTP pyrophosphatase (non-canonical NTP hydrolase)